MSSSRSSGRQGWHVHAGCLKAGATFNFALDEADRAAGRHITCSVLALWAGTGGLPKWYDPLAVRRAWADDVRGRAIDAGHFLAEEAPDVTYTELRTFFAE